MDAKGWAVLDFFWQARLYLIRKQLKHEPLDAVDEKVKRFVVAWDELVKQLTKERGKVKAQGRGKP